MIVLDVYQSAGYVYLKYDGGYESVYIGGEIKYGLTELIGLSVDQAKAMLRWMEVAESK